MSEKRVPGQTFERGIALEVAGRDGEAQEAYLAVLAADSTHCGALINLGNLALRTGRTSAALTAYRRAVQFHPNNPTGHVNLANTLLREDDLSGARESYEAALAIDRNHPEANQGLSYVYARLGDEDRSRPHRDLGFADRSSVVLPYRGSGKAVRAIVLLSAAGGNVQTDFVLDDRTFHTVKIFTEYYDEKVPLPDRDLIFNAIGDADRCAEALCAARMLIAASGKRVFNDPAAVARTTRVKTSERFAGVRNLVTPRTALCSRDTVRATIVDLGLTYPLLLRSPGHHNGAHFLRLDSALELDAAMASLPGSELLVIEYLDARGVDGKVRKYRAMAIDGELYPLHLAISDTWKVHYVSSMTTGDAEHESEETAFLEGMAAALGPEAMAALRAVVDGMALDYAGIDFGIDAEGRILLFEANATMIVLPPERDAFADRHGSQAERILSAVRAMLLAPG